MIYIFIYKSNKSNGLTYFWKVVGGRDKRTLMEGNTLYLFELNVCL